MIDKLQNISQAIRYLRLPAIAVGLFCLVLMIVTILDSGSRAGDKFLIPSFVGILWALSTYAFIVTFQSVPEKADSSLGMIGKLRRHIHRSWYWLISTVFLASTLAAIYFTNSLLSVWLRNYSDTLPK